MFNRSAENVQNIDSIDRGLIAFIEARNPCQIFRKHTFDAKFFQKIQGISQKESLCPLNLVDIDYWLFLIQKETKQKQHGLN